MLNHTYNTQLQVAADEFAQCDVIISTVTERNLCDLRDCQKKD